MALTVHVGLDLGSDTLKIAYALKDGRRTVTGKIVGDGTAMTAVPAVSYFDTAEGKWLYGYEVDSVGDRSFVTVVKIKSLLSLLSAQQKKSVFASNREYYFGRDRFPKFYFPRRRKRSDDFAEADRIGMTFGGGITPAELCRNYFLYVKKIVDGAAGRLAARYGEKNAEVIPSVVCPQFCGSDYSAELSRLVTLAFGRKPAAELSITKALCVYAAETGRVEKGDFSLLFNLGEECVSVVKTSFSESGVSVDGADGHSDPLGVGGNDIDDAVAEYLEGELSDRETMGRPSSGEEGHIAEAPLSTKQYLFVKDIKAAKVIFGLPNLSGAFAGGVPVCVSRDLFIQRKLTREEFLKCTGISDGTGIAKRICDYIREELSRPVNSDVNKVYLTGGCVEAYGLVDCIKKAAGRRGVSICTFESESSPQGGDDEFTIYAYEDALYAPALGCAAAALKGLDIKTVLALSYGLRLYLNNKPFLELLVNKGTELPQGGRKFYTPSDYDEIGISTIPDSEHSARMRIMSTFLTQRDINARKFSPDIEYFAGSGGQNYLLANIDSVATVRKLQQKIGLKMLSAAGDKPDSGYINYYYNGARVSIAASVNIVIGVNIDGEGRAKPYAENDPFRNASRMVSVKYLENVVSRGKIVRRRGETERVFAKDIKFDFDIGEVDFM